MVDSSLGNSPYAITSGAAFTFVNDGETSTGVIDHTAGTLSIQSTLTIGNQKGSSGLYKLSGSGIINVAQEFVGNSGLGSFVQSGTSNNSASFLGLGSDGGGTCTFQLNGGTLAVNSESIGSYGAATFTQTGGTHTVIASGNFILGNDSLASYTLTGGTLQIPKVVQNTGAGSFIFNGGTLQANADATAFMAGLSAATVQAGGAIIDTNGHSITVAQSLLSGGANDGGLRKQGVGTLTLSGANTYVGGTVFVDGILAVGSTGALGGSGALSFSGGTLQYSAANTTDYSTRFSGGAGQAFRVDTAGQNVTFNSGLGGSGSSLYKSGNGTLTLKGTNTYTGGTYVLGGTLELAAPGTLNNTNLINVATQTVFRINGGTVTSTGTIINNGTIFASHGATLDFSGAASFTNNGLLDLINGDGRLPSNFVNGAGGVVLTRDLVRVKSIARTSTGVTVRIDSYTGHSFQLQRSTSPVGSSFLDIGSVQTGATGTTLTFTDLNPPSGQAFYRVVVDS